MICKAIVAPSQVGSWLVSEQSILWIATLELLLSKNIRSQQYTSSLLFFHVYKIVGAASTLAGTFNSQGPAMQSVVNDRLNAVTEELQASLRRVQKSPGVNRNVYYM